MPDTDWERLEALFHQASELETGPRSLFLEEACADRPDLKGRVEAMVRALQGPGDPLATSVESVAMDLEGALAPSLVGARLGPYRVVEEVGRGGMGSVFKAERADGAYDAQVAIKVIRGAAVDPALHQRFLAERRILAGLAHPSIASLLDAGTTRDGLPYMVMELVEGTPITRYCDERRLSVAARLRLFTQVCTAVQYAHQNLVVHRDLKPSNILVTEHGVPKLVDFGVAKLLAEGLGEGMTQTVARNAVLTPAYASPEQLAGEPITVATDVYGLGLVLYELLTGQRAHRFDGRGAVEMERVVRFLDPPTLRAAARARDLALVAKLRSTTIHHLDRTLGGDLASVVMKALRKDPARRYGSVLDLARDLDAAREGRTVSARPDTVRYRLSRFVGRNRKGVAAAGLAALTLAALMVTIVVQNVRTRAERDLAERRRAVAAEVSTFLVGVFGSGQAAPGAPVTPESVLEAGERRIASLADRPAVQAGLMDAVGRLYLDLGLTEAAERTLLRSLELRRDLFGNEDADVGASLAAVGRLRGAQGDYEAAEARFRSALVVLSDALGAGHPETGASRLELARVLGAKGDFAAADSVYRSALAATELGDASEVTRAEVFANRSELLAEQGDLAAAREASSSALSIRTRVLPPDHDALAYSRTQVERLGLGGGPLGAGPVERHRAPIPAPFEAVTGDFDGDGATELLWSHRRGSENLFYTLADPAARAHRHPVADPPLPWEDFEVRAGDVDGDGRDDLVFNARSYGNHVFVALSRPGGAFEYGPLWTHPYAPDLAPTWSTSEVVVYDADQDGRDDVVWYHGTRMMLWVGHARGDGTFRAGEARQLFRDPRSLPTSILGRPADFVPFSEGDAPRVVRADLDGDGHTELVWSWLEDRNEAWGVWWDGTALQAAGPALRYERGNNFLRRGIWHYYRALAGDVDGDGRDDVIWADPATPFPPADAAKRVYVARSRSAELRLDLTPEGGYQDGLLGDVPAPLEVRTGDVNGDGRADLVWNRRTRSGENRVWVTLGRPDGTFAPAGAPSLHPAGPDWTRATWLVLDSDGDGRDELVWNLPGAVNRVFRMVWEGAAAAE